MIHLFKHKDGKFDIALVVKGKFIWGTPQGYSRRLGAYKALISTSFHCGHLSKIYFQDDTQDVPVICCLEYSKGGRVFYIKKSGTDTHKPYIPNKK
jgi:hypothetical protein